MTIDRELTVELLEPRSNLRNGLVDELTALINDVYAAAESGLWQNGATRAARRCAASRSRVAAQEVRSRA